MHKKKHKKVSANFKKIVQRLMKEEGIETYKEFCRRIEEDTADLHRWLQKDVLVTPRAVIAICRVYPRIKAHDINPVVFPENLKLVWE